MKLRSKLLGGCIAAAGLLAFASFASADTINYVNVTNHATVTITEPTGPDQVWAGQIKMHDVTTGNDLYTWCLDVYHWLSSGQWDSGSLAPLTAVVEVAPANPPITSTGLTINQLNKISSLMVWGDANTGTANYFGQGSTSGSAAAQLAIWSVEYGAYDSSSNPGGFASNISGSLKNLTDYLIANDVASPSLPISYIVGQSNNQLLGFVNQSNQVSQTPLPGGLPLFVSGFGLLGLLAMRRKRKSAFAAT